MPSPALSIWCQLRASVCSLQAPLPPLVGRLGRSSGAEGCPPLGKGLVVTELPGPASRPLPSKQPSLAPQPQGLPDQGMGFPQSRMEKCLGVPGLPAPHHPAHTIMHVCTHTHTVSVHAGSWDPGRCRLQPLRAGTPAPESLPGPCSPQAGEQLPAPSGCLPTPQVCPSGSPPPLPVLGTHTPHQAEPPQPPWAQRGIWGVVCTPTGAVAYQEQGQERGLLLSPPLRDAAQASPRLSWGPTGFLLG